MLRYWIRSDPATGVAAVARAVKRNGKGDTACFRNVLVEVLQNTWADETLPVCLEALKNEDLEVIRSATTALAAHAGPATVDRIIDAIENISKRPLPEKPADRNFQLYLPSDLTGRLLNSKRWQLTFGQLQRLLEAATDEALKARLKKAIETTDPNG